MSCRSGETASLHLHRHRHISHLPPIISHLPSPPLVPRPTSSQPIRDGETVNAGGLVATEFLVGALMVEGTSVAAQVKELEESKAGAESAGG